MALAAASAAILLEFAPQHWLKRVAVAAVRVDGRPVHADVYLGHPTRNEADGIALVHVPGVGDYFLDFENAMYREASPREFIRFGPGAWTFQRMSDGRFSAVLPIQNRNEFRFATSDRHLVTVQF